MQLNNENYYSHDAAKEFMSYSQYVGFKRCEAAAFAEFAGDYTRRPSTALLQGAYMDACVEGTRQQFLEDHPEMISSRGPTKGEIKAEYKKLDDIFERVQRDEFFMSYINGAEKQVIVTGEIGGILFKGKIDLLFPDKIVDFKCMADFKPIWDPELNMRVPFADFWGYVEQAAIYQELILQTTGNKLPFYGAAVTKEETPDLAVISYPDDILKFKLDEIQQIAPRYDAIKNGIIEPQRCGHCDFCKQSKVLTKVIDYRDMGVLYE